jgi:23S rRNA G2069 N7-methylase RlmK/C1962 C5-methylase RlmI
MYKEVILKKNKEESILRKHPWVFSGAIDLIDEEVMDGDLVSVYDSKKRFLAIGHFQNGWPRGPENHRGPLETNNSQWFLIYSFYLMTKLPL